MAPATSSEPRGRPRDYRALDVSEPQRWAPGWAPSRGGASLAARCAAVAAPLALLLLVASAAQGRQPREAAHPGRQPQEAARLRAGLPRPRGSALGGLGELIGLDGQAGLCAVYGCSGFASSRPCQCDAACANFNNCCSDYQGVCPPSAPVPPSTAAPSTAAPSTAAPSTAAPSTTAAAPITTVAPNTTAAAPMTTAVPSTTAGATSSAEAAPSTTQAPTSTTEAPTTTAETITSTTETATTTEAATSTTQVPCLTAPFGSECYKRVVWVLRYGVHQHPEWYPNITVMSSFETTQALLHEKGECHCPKPCGPPLDPSKVDLFPWSSLPAEDRKSKPLLEQVAAAITSQLAKASVAPFICNPTVPMDSVSLVEGGEDAKPASSSAESSLWELPRSTVDQCFELLLAKGTVKEADRKFKRNWCWVGLKESGCHSHFYDHLTWAEMQALAVRDNATVNASYQPLEQPGTCDQPVFGGTMHWSDDDWAMAGEWFQENVAVYVLSLATSEERRAVAKARFAELGISFAFVDGVDMRREGALHAAKAEGLIPVDFNVTRAQEEAYRARQNMGVAGSIMGTVGCASGHFRAQRHGLMRHPRYLTLVFEDDVSPEDDFVPRLWRLVTRELPCDWQAVSLNSRCPFGACISPHLTRVRPDVNEPAWRCRHGVNYGFQGMLYRTSEIENLQKVWKPVVFDEARPHCLDVDVALASISDRVRFYAVPASQNPGFLHEVAMGSSRVDINFQKQATTTTTTAAGAAPASPATAPAAGARGNEPFCGSRHGGACIRDGRSKGWCNRKQQNCRICSGDWCEPGAPPWEHPVLAELQA